MSLGDIIQGSKLVLIEMIQCITETSYDDYDYKEIANQDYDEL